MILQVMNISTIYQFITGIVTLGLLIACIEDLFTWSTFTERGLMSWKISRLSVPWISKGRFTRILDFLLNDSCFRYVLITKCVITLLLFVYCFYAVPPSFLFALLLCLQGLLSFRSQYGLDGAHQMNFCVLLALFSGTLFGMNSILATISLWFITASLLVSYLVAGVIKLFSPIWQTGGALPLIFSTHSYGSSFFYGVLRKKKEIPLLLCWSVVLFETLFISVLFFNPVTACFFLLIGFLFHVFNALFMGLNGFLFAFTAPYPALLYSVYQIHGS